jgi:hypothetical protein
MASEFYQKNTALERNISVEEYIAFLIYEDLEIPEDQRNGIIVRID